MLNQVRELNIQDNNFIELMEDMRQISIDIDMSFYPKDEDGNNVIDKEYKKIRKRAGKLFKKDLLSKKDYLYIKESCGC